MAAKWNTGYDQVTYGYIDTATKVKPTITCFALDFISRLVPHIPPNQT